MSPFLESVSDAGYDFFKTQTEVKL